MEETSSNLHSPLDIPLALLLGRALRCRCPHCGMGKLYQAYLKPVKQCSNCGESYDGIRADDGPAWLTILIAGHIIIPLFITLQGGASDPNWWVMIFCCVFLVILVLGLLPFTKALFIAVIWRHQNAKVRKPTNTPPTF